MATTSTEIMTIGETAEYLRISLSSLYKLAQDGRIPCQKVGRHWRFFKPAIQEWIARKNLSSMPDALSEANHPDQKAN